MNPRSSRPGPSQQLHGCEGDGCASARDTWPLHHVYRRGVRSRLCNSCILLSHRSYYCCSCFFLIPCASLWPSHEDGNPFVAPSAPIITCQVCHEAIAHLACLDPSNGVFVCPACSAAAEGRPFTYAPPCNTPLDERGARVLVVGAQLALVLLQRTAGMARAEAERLAQNAADLRRRAQTALGAAMELHTEEPSWNVDVQPVAPSENRLELGEGSQTRVNAPPLVQQPRRAMPLPPLSAQTVSRGGVTQLAMAATEVEQLTRAASRRRAHRALGVAVELDTEEPSWNVNIQPVAPSEKRLELGEGSETRVKAPPLVQQPRRAMPLPPLSAQTVGRRGVTQLATADTEAGRLARNAAASRRRGHRALGVAMEHDTEEPSWNVDVQSVAPSENRLELGEGSQTRVNAPPLVQQLRRAMPPQPLSALTIGRGTVAQFAMAATEAERLARNVAASPRRAQRALGVAMELDTEEPSWNLNVQPVAPSENRMELGEGSQTRVNAPPLVQQLRRAMSPPPLSALTVGRWSVAQLAMASTEAAREVSLPPWPAKTLPLFGVTKAATAAVAEVSPSTPPTLQLFPDKASSSGTKPRTLQLFNDKMPDEDDEDM